MKKIRMSKRGFTLTEIIIVVAIIVIVAAGAFVGVAIALDKAKKQRDEVTKRHGQSEDGKELFEADAWNKVDSLVKGAAEFFDADTYDPDEGGGNDITDNGGGNDSNNGDSSLDENNNKPTEKTESDAERREREKRESEAAESSRIQASIDASVSASAASVSASISASLSESEEAEKNKPKPQGRVGSSTGTTACDNTSVSGSVNSGMTFNLPVAAKEIVIYASKGSIDGLSCYAGNCTVTKSGKYFTITRSEGSPAISSSGFGVWGSLDGVDPSDFKVVSYVPG